MNREFLMALVRGAVPSASLMRTSRDAGVVVLGLFLTMAVTGCRQPPAPQAPVAESANQSLLDEANAVGKWFHAKKTRPIWAKRLDAEQVVQTLEGEERVAAGHYLCKGEAGDLWPQTEQTLQERYVATDEVNAEGWRKYQPHPDAQGVLVTPIEHPFEVQATWGRLTGKPGDFLVKKYQDRETTYPADVWIVDQTLFRQTYEPVTTSP